MKILKLIIAGGSAFAVNVGFLYIFTEYFGWMYLVSATLSFIISIAVGFSINKFWTYVDHSKDKMYTQMSLYLGINLVNLVLNLAMLYVLVDFFGMWYILAQVITSIILAFESFFLYGWLFNKPLHQ